MFWPLLILGGIVTLIAWPSIAGAFGQMGMGGAPSFNPSQGDVLTILNSRPGAADPAIGASASVQQEVMRALLDNYGYRVQMIANGGRPVMQGNMSGYLSQWAVLGKAADISIPANMGLRDPGLTLVNVTPSPLSQMAPMGAPGSAVSPMG